MTAQPLTVSIRKGAVSLLVNDNWVLDESAWKLLQLLATHISGLSTVMDAAQRADRHASD